MLKPRLYYLVRDYVRAVREEPKGVLCGWCRRPNFFADDCGFFCITPEGDDTRVTCEHCFRGPLGQAHVARYGMGER